jgi:hypothetical protein
MTGHLGLTSTGFKRISLFQRPILQRLLFPIPPSSIDIICGVEVVFNGQAMKDVPKEREPTEFASTFHKALDQLYE